MDDGLEFVIYILFVALSLIGGIYNNYAKKKAEQKKLQGTGQQEEFSPDHETTDYSEDYSTNKSNPFEEFIQQQLQNKTSQSGNIEEIEENNIAKEFVQKQKIHTSAFENTDNAISSDNFFEKGFNKSHSITNNEIGSISDNEISDINDVIQEFDAKKAFIYSEILKRPNL